MVEQRKDNPFNPEHREEKKFSRLSNRKKIYTIAVLTALLVYGGKEFIFTETIQIEIHNAMGTKIDDLRITPGENFFYIVNSSPWKITLKFSSDIEFITNYDGQEIRPGQVINALFDSNQTGVINVSWKKD